MIAWDVDLLRDLERERADLARWEAEEAEEWRRDHPDECDGAQAVSAS